MHVVGHKAIGPHLRARPLRRLGQQIEVERIVSILEERLLAAIAALRYVVRDAREDCAGKTGHLVGLAKRGGMDNSLGVIAPVTVIRNPSRNPILIP